MTLLPRPPADDSTELLIARRFAGLVAVAQALGDAESERAVLEVVTGRGVRLLGAAGAVLTLLEPDGHHVRTLTTALFNEQVQTERSVLPLDFPLPMVHTAHTGTALFLRDRAEAVAMFPTAADIYERNRTDASAAIPIRSGEVSIGALSVAWSGPHPFDAADRELLETFASLCGQALGRIAQREAEREAAAATRSFSETLQRRLLSRPPALDPLQVAVRYQPAAQEAHIGGDWYDAFRTSDGATVLVIGDVSGHDGEAAAAMAQVRNVLRGVAHALTAGPSAVLGVVDRALQDLDIDLLATAVVVQLPTRAPGSTSDVQTMRWSNAGHLPPLLITSEGAVTQLQSEPDLLLGLEPNSERVDHVMDLAPGSTLLLYTDGLVERRRQPVNLGLQRLERAAGEHAERPLEDFCDALLSAMETTGDDDIALVVLRLPGPDVDASALDLVPGPTAVRRARAFVRAKCQAGGVDGAAREAAVLMTSEIVTNAFLHGRSSARLTVTAGSDRLWVEVSDDNSVLPRLGAHDDEALDSRGLAIVDSLATAWGAREHGTGKVVWFELLFAQRPIR